MKAEGGQKWPDSVTVSRRGGRGGEVDQPSTAFHLLQIIVGDGVHLPFGRVEAYP